MSIEVRGGKFWFGENVWFIFDGDRAVLKILNDEDRMEFILGEYYIDSKLFEKAYKILTRLEEKEFPLHRVLEFMDAFIERESMKFTISQLF